MITRIREERRAKKLTLDDVAQRCDPQTTPQTIGRLETGTGTLTTGGHKRIAAALYVHPLDLVEAKEAANLRFGALLDQSGAHAPAKEMVVVPPLIDDSQFAVLVHAGFGDYRAGDEIWCQSLQPDEFGRAMNRDVLIPRPAGRFLF